ncbi:MAG: DNA replication/repair protein RecF [Gammaproteobacteria bacterium]
MPITRLKITDVRNLQAVEIRPSPSLNVIWGANASGKTSVLEAIHVLGRGRSFRAGKLEHLVRHGQERLQVFGTVMEGPEGPEIPIGVERGKDGFRARIAGRDVRTAAELSERLPLMVVSPDSQALLEEGPTIRRQFLDWGVFHVEPRFWDVWVRYDRALRQRNALLRARGRNAAIDAWDGELIRCATQIDHFRSAYIEEYCAVLPQFSDALAALGDVVVDYQRGWPAEEPYEDMLKRNRTRDRELQHTHLGPHRADLRVRVGKTLARDLLSRGQQKVLVVALRMAQVAVLRNRTGRGCTVLLDDLAAELDADHREKLLLLLRDLGVQAFVTAVERNAVTASWWDTQKMFHVEHGRLTEMV